MVKKKMIESFFCEKCSEPKHFIFQKDNELYTLCCKCGQIMQLNELVIEFKEKKQLEGIK